MKKIRHAFIEIIITCLLVTACQESVPVNTETPEPEPTPVPLPTESPPEPIRQWAAEARSESEPVTYDPNWGTAAGAIGEPKGQECPAKEIDGFWVKQDAKRIDGAWTVGGDGESHVLEVYFEEAVIPSEINIHEAYGGDLVNKVELIDSEGAYHEVYAAESTIKNFECINTLHIPLESAAHETTGARITVITKGWWHQIDAVELVGMPTGNRVELPEPAAFVEPPPAGERALYDRPDDFPGTFQVHVLYLLASDNVDRERDINGQVAKSFELANEWFAGQSGGQTFRLDTYQGELDVTFIRLEQTESEINNATVDLYPWGLQSRMSYLIDNPDTTGFERLVNPRPGKLYILVVEFEQVPDFAGNAYENGYMVVRPRADWITRPAFKDVAYQFEFLILHELSHEVGFVPECAENSHVDGHHVTDDNQDLMWAPADPYAEFYYDLDNYVLDYGNDDYFNHEIFNCPDLADSAFLYPPTNKAYLPDWLDHLRFSD